MLLSRAEFWRLRGRFAAVCLLLNAAVLALPAKAESRRAGHHHHVARFHHHSAVWDIRYKPLISVSRRGDAVGIAMRFLGSGNPTGTHRAWCGDFVNMTERLADRHGLVAGGLASA